MVRAHPSAAAGRACHGDLCGHGRPLLDEPPPGRRTRASWGWRPPRGARACSRSVGRSWASCSEQRRRRECSASMWHRRAQASRCSSSSSAEAPERRSGGPSPLRHLADPRLRGRVLPCRRGRHPARQRRVTRLKPQAGAEPSPRGCGTSATAGSTASATGTASSSPAERRTELRVLVLGDSFTYRTGVADPADLFTTVLARELAGTGRFAGVRVFNAGEPGADSAVDFGTLPSFSGCSRTWSSSPTSSTTSSTSRASRSVTRRSARPRWRVAFRPHRLLMLNSHFFDQGCLRYRRAWRATSGAQSWYMRAYADPVLFARSTLADIARTASAPSCPVSSRLRST